jgi:glycosyltransferase involved in cell wall biosynthesis
MAYRRLLPLLAARADRVATVSRFSADMLPKYGICAEDKIFIAPNGHEHVLRRDASRANVSVLSDLKRRYILLLGSLAKHKNIEIILRQAQALDKAGIEIIVAGGALNVFAADAPTISRPNIHRVGFVGDDHLAALYKSALCLVLQSTSEGFGIPPLEAMAFGCPVISSNAACLVEAGGDAVIYVDPGDGDRWREAIIALSANDHLRASMSEKGRQRASLFSWKRSAAIHLNEIQGLL